MSARITPPYPPMEALLVDALRVPLYFWLPIGFFDALNLGLHNNAAEGPEGAVRLLGSQGSFVSVFDRGDNIRGIDAYYNEVANRLGRLVGALAWKRLVEHNRQLSSEVQGSTSAGL